MSLSHTHTSTPTHAHTHSLRKGLFLRKNLSFEGNWLLTSPNEVPSLQSRLTLPVSCAGTRNLRVTSSHHLLRQPRPQPLRHYGATPTEHENSKKNLAVQVHQQSDPPSSSATSGPSSSWHTASGHLNSSNPVANRCNVIEEEDTDL